MSVFDLGLCSLQTLLKAGEQCWSLAELVQAVVILAHCHSLSSFVFGCDTDSDFVPLSKSPSGTPSTLCPFDAANGNTNVPQSHAAPLERRTRRRVNESHTFKCYMFATQGFIMTEGLTTKLELVIYALKSSKYSQGCIK